MITSTPPPQARLRRMPGFLALAAVLCAWPLSGSQAATVQVTGVAGSAGLPGARGDPGAPGQDGGPGGDGVAVTAPDNADATNLITAAGGNGGNGGSGGDGEDGDDADADADGGTGGNGGLGGDASAAGTTTVLTGNAELRVRAFGGQGGSGRRGGAADGNGTPGSPGQSGDGGNATASAVASSPGDLRVDVRAVGGDAGEPWPGGAGAAGGTATLGPVHGQSTGGGKVEVWGLVTGGTGRAGASDIVLDNAINGTTSGHLMLWQVAEAGSTQGFWEAGDDALDVPAGNAISNLSRTGDMAILQVQSEAIGGQGFHSGDGTAVSEAVNTSGEAVAFSLASGGSAEASRNDGRGGTGTAVSRAEGRVGYITADAESYGGAHRSTGGQWLGHGGDAYSQAEAVATDGAQASAGAFARGGRGGQSGGSAVAVGTATGQGGSASVNVLAIGGEGAGAAPEGSATAVGLAVVRSDTLSAGVLSRTEGGSGAASAAVDMAGAALTAGLATAEAPVAGDGTTRVYTQARAAGGLASDWSWSNAQLPDSYAGSQAGVLAAVLPGVAMVNGALAGNPGVATALSAADPAILYAILGGGFPVTGAGGAQIFSSTIALSLDTAQIEAGGGLLIGWLDPSLGGGGFDELRMRIDWEGATVFDQIYTDPAAAALLFNDQILDLAPWSTTISGDLDLLLQVDLTASAPGDYFYVNLLAATTGAPAVPLPASIWLLSGALLALPGYRGWRQGQRRRNSG